MDFSLKMLFQMYFFLLKIFISNGFSLCLWNARKWNRKLRVGECFLMMLHLFWKSWLISYLKRIDFKKLCHHFWTTPPKTEKNPFQVWRRKNKCRFQLLFPNFFYIYFYFLSFIVINSNHVLCKNPQFKGLSFWLYCLIFLIFWSRNILFLVFYMLRFYWFSGMC